MRFSIFSFLILTVLVFSSCGKEKVFDKKDKEEFKDKGKDKGEKEGDKDEKEDCFELLYPITYNMPDGSTITGNNEEEVETALKAWYDAHSNSEEKPVLQYPVDAIFKDATTKTINNEEEMEAAKKSCEKNDATCEWDGTKVADSAIWDKYIVEPLITDEQCGCIVSGVVKYVEKAGKTVFIEYYGKGECDEWAYLVICYDGNCKDKKTEKCKFKLNCTASEG